MDKVIMIIMQWNITQPYRRDYFFICRKINEPEICEVKGSKPDAKRKKITFFLICGI
jgi:hypothetical protein